MIPPAPMRDQNIKSAVWSEWFRQVRDNANLALLTATWTGMDFTSSNITDILSRAHNNLQTIQGGTAGEYYHLTSAEYTGTGTGVFARQDSPKFTTQITLPKTSGAGIKVDTTTPTYGWRDITGNLTIRATGVNDPQFNQYNGTAIRQYQFSNTAMNEMFFEYHIPHDYVPGTELYIHVHWSQTTVDSGGTAGAPGAAKWSFDALYAKGHQQQAFPAAVTTVTVTQTASSTIRQHNIAEVQLTTSGAIGGNAIEVDGVIMVRAWRNPGDVADTLNVLPFVHFVDLHYQSTNMATKEKSPNFYGA